MPYLDGTVARDGTRSAPPVYNCPDDQFRPSIDSDFPYIEIVDDRTNYFCNAGANALPPTHDYGSMFVALPRSRGGVRTTGSAQVKDGLSTTALMAEGLPSDVPGNMPYWLATNFQDELESYPPHPAVAAECAASTEQLDRFNPFSRGLYSEWGGENLRYDHVMPPNTRSGLFPTSDGSRAPNSGCFDAASNHRGGVHLSTADGAVHFVADAIAPRVWFAIGTSRGGEVVSDVTAF